MTATFGRASTSSPDLARVHAARRGVLTLFWLMGVLVATFVSRVPSVATLLSVSTGQLAQLLLFGALGAFVALMVTGWSVARFGTRALLLWSSFGYLAAFALVAWSTMTGSHFAFAAGQFGVSFAFAFTNVSMNAEAANVERWIKRPIMPHFHASFSVGMAMGLGLGALISHAGVAPMGHFIAVAIVLTVVRVAVIPLAVIDGRPIPGAATGGLGGPFATARAEYRDRRVVLLGLIVFAASTIEGAAAQWASLAIVTGFRQSEAIGDLFYWVFVIAMVTTRGFGAHIIQRLGRVASLRASAVLVLVGVLIFAFSPVIWVIPLGMVLWGLGAGLGVPIGFSAASDEPHRAASRVAAVSSFATVAGLIMPQIIGHLGDVIELRKALTVAAFAAVLSFAIARAVRKDVPLFRSRGREARAVGAARLADGDAASVVVAEGVEPVQAAPRVPDTLNP